MDFNFIGLDEIWAEVFSHRKLERECRRYRLWDFPGDPVFRVLPVLGTWAQSLVQELRSHTPAKKKKKKSQVQATLGSYRNHLLGDWKSPSVDTIFDGICEVAEDGGSITCDFKALGSSVWEKG